MKGGPDGHLTHDEFSHLQAVLDAAERPEQLAHALSGDPVHEGFFRSPERVLLDRVALLEGFTGTKTDSKGRKECYRDGQHVPCGKAATTGAQARRKAKATAQPQAHVHLIPQGRTVKDLARSALHVFGAAKHSVQHAEHVAKDFLAHGVDERLARLPPKVGAPAKATWWGLKMATKGAFLSYSLGQAAAERVAAEAGASPEAAARLRGWCTGLDLIGAKAVPLTLGAVGLGGIAAAASFIPAGSVAYLAYAGVRHPIATLNAGRKAVADAMRRLHLLPRIIEGLEIDADLHALLHWLTTHTEPLADAVLGAALDVAHDLSEALTIADEALRHAEPLNEGLLPLREDGFTGVKTDSLGRQEHYRDGKHVAGPHNANTHRAPSSGQKDDSGRPNGNLEDKLIALARAAAKRKDSPDYGNLYYDARSGKAWYVTADGDGRIFTRWLFSQLEALVGKDKARVEAEASPPKDERWEQLYPKRQVREGLDVYEARNFEQGLLDRVALLEYFTGQKTDSRGYKICYADGKRVPCARLKGTPHEGHQLIGDYRPSVDALHKHYGEVVKHGDHAALTDFAHKITGLTREGLRDLRRRIGASHGGGLKEDLVRKIRGKAPAPAAPAEHQSAIARALHAGKGPHNLVGLDKLRAASGLSRADFDRAMHELRKSGAITLSTKDRNVSPGEHAAAISGGEGANPLHLASVKDEAALQRAMVPTVKALQSPDSLAPAASTAVAVPATGEEQHRTTAAKWVAQANLPAETAARYTEDMAHALSKLPAGIHKKAMESLASGGGATFHASERDLQNEATRITGKRAAGTVGFVVDDRLGGNALHVDGGADAKGTYVHELWHCADSGGEISDDKGWQSAYKKEVLKGRQLLSRYAMTNPSEGLAEFGRVLAARGEAYMTSNYPACVKYLKSKGLM